HLCALTVLNDTIQRIPSRILNGVSPTISPAAIAAALASSTATSGAAVEGLDILPRLRGMILCSGIFDINQHYRHETRRGIQDISGTARIMKSSLTTQTTRKNGQGMVVPIVSTSPSASTAANTGSPSSLSTTETVARFSPTLILKNLLYHHQNEH